MFFCYQGDQLTVHESDGDFSSFSDGRFRLDSIQRQRIRKEFEVNQWHFVNQKRTVPSLPNSCSEGVLGIFLGSKYLLRRWLDP